MPGARCALRVQREWCQKKTPGPAKSHTRVFISSLPTRDKVRAASATRNHWGVENRNHYKRDTSVWQEDRHRHRRDNAALNLALTRNALLAIIPFEQGEPLAQFFELYHRYPTRALNLILHSRPVL